MKHHSWSAAVAIILGLLGASGCADQATHTDSPPAPVSNTADEETVKLRGMVLKKPWSKTGESWEAGGGEYYVLDVGSMPVAERSAKEGVILRPSVSVPVEEFESFVGRAVMVSGRYVKSSPPHEYGTDPGDTGQLLITPMVGDDGKPLVDSQGRMRRWVMGRGAGLAVDHIALLEGPGGKK